MRRAVHRCCVVNPGKQSREARSRNRAACHPAVYHGVKGPKLRRPFFLTVTAHGRTRSCALSVTPALKLSF